MRPLEWLFLFSFLPILLTPFIPQTWRRRWLVVTVPLPTLMGGLHVIVEGWRIEIVPLYLLAGIVLVSRLPVLLGRESTVRRRRGMLMSSVGALLLVLSGVVAGWLVPVFKLPSPTGPYHVGVVDRELVDKARGRRLMVTIWYPAAQGGPPAPLTHYPDEVATALGNLFGSPAALYQHIRYITLDATDGVPLATDRAPFPVLVFSHGLVGLRLQNSSTLQELASWGYVIVAIDHTDAAAVTVFPDGDVRFYNMERFGIPPDVEPDEKLVTDRVFPVWVADQRFVYDMLETWAVNDPLLAGKLDVTRIGSFGHSFGGAVSLEVCRVDSRCRAAVDMDGGLYGQTLTQPSVRPLLLMTSAESMQLSYAVKRWRQMIANADAPAYWLELPGSTHLSFTITQLLSPLLVPKGFDPRAGLHTVDKYLRAFFDTHLSDVKTLPLGPASGETDVRWITH
jgi:predicted dienelactone hydrolase